MASKKRTNASRIGRFSLYVLVYAAVVIFWEALVDVAHYPNWLLPAPSVIAVTMARNLYVLLLSAYATLFESVLGFLLAVFIASALAILVIYYEVAYRTLYPLIVGFNALPKTALAPLFVIWFGLGLYPKIVMALAISFFPIFSNTLVGLKEVPSETLDVIRILNATKAQEFEKIRIPSSSVYWFAGLKAALPLTIVGAVVAEFISGNQGLGFYILTAMNTIQTNQVFAGLLMTLFISVGLYFSIDVIEGLVLKWSPSRRKR